MRNCKNKWQFAGTTVGLNRSADGLNSIAKNFSQMNQDLFSFVVSITALISTSPVKRRNASWFIQSPASQCTDPGSTPELFTWDFWWNKWQWDTCFCKYIVVPCPYYFTNAACSFIHLS